LPVIVTSPHTALEFPDLIRPFLENESLLENYQHAAGALAEKSYSRKILSEKFVTAVTTDT
jgi:hypothetical protein